MSVAKSNVLDVAELSSTFQREGYLVLPGVVSRAKLDSLVAELRSEFARAQKNGELFSGGGMISGHLNCFPGATSRFVYEELERHGVFDLVRKLAPDAVRPPNVGCNFNLPHSSAQNPHIDGFLGSPFLVVNVAAVDTDLRNGATEVVPRTHLRGYKYWQYAMSGLPAVRLVANAGDVSIRVSTLWHRGMPNLTDVARPMLAFSWENGGSALADPYAAHNGKITFLMNRYGHSRSEKMKEKAFAAVPAIGTGYLFVRSIFQ